MQELGDNEVRDLLVDRRAEKDDPVCQEARVNVDHPLLTRVPPGHHWDHDAHLSLMSRTRGALGTRPRGRRVGERSRRQFAQRIFLALAAYRHELLVDPGVHYRLVETAREADLPRKTLPCLHAKPLLA